MTNLTNRIMNTSRNAYTHLHEYIYLSSSIITACHSCLIMVMNLDVNDNSHTHTNIITQTHTYTHTKGTDEHTIKHMGTQSVDQDY